MMTFKEQKLQFGTFGVLECDSRVNDSAATEGRLSGMDFMRLRGRCESLLEMIVSQEQLGD